VFPIAVPALRERTEDIPDLVRHFLARIAAEEGKRVRTISGEALALLGRHRWPGNVRQLENAVFRAVVLAEGDTIGTGEFPQVAAQITQAAFAPASADLPHIASAPTMSEVPHPHDSNIAPAGAPSMAGALALLDAHGDVRPLEELEYETIRFAIAHYRGQMSEVARRLRIGRSTLYRKLEHLGLGEQPKEPA
jgi:DNA-binding NtrC family response regulator